MFHGTGKRWLYVIADFSYGKKAIEEVLKAGVDYIQLREKKITSAEYLQRARYLVEMARSFKTKVIINDRVDIAWLSGAHGVHLGQEDVPITEARRLLGEGKIIGATAKTPEQAKKAEVMGANYVGSGAWFSTRTKEDAVSITFDQYLHILNTVTIPSLAVGGIKKENCHLPLKAGADGLAISEGIMGAENISKEICKIRKLLERTS